MPLESIFYSPKDQSLKFSRKILRIGVFFLVWHLDFFGEWDKVIYPPQTFLVQVYRQSTQNFEKTNLWGFSKLDLTV